MCLVIEFVVIIKLLCCFCMIGNILLILFKIFIIFMFNIICYLLYLWLFRLFWGIVLVLLYSILICLNLEMVKLIKV